MGIFGTSFSFTGPRETVAQSLKDFRELDSELSCAPHPPAARLPHRAACDSRET